MGRRADDILSPDTEARFRRTTAGSTFPHWRSGAAGHRLPVFSPDDDHSAIAICVYLSAIRIASYGVQESFYIVYLKEIGLSGENIGLLAGTGHSLLGAIGALMLGLAPQIVSIRRQLYLFLVTVIFAIVLISISPLLVDFWPLFAAITLRGLLLGFNHRS